jgi:hypothetical protein
MQIRRLLLRLLVGSFFAMLPAKLAAQGTDLGTIRGAVTDSSGAVVPKAEVTITDLSTNTSHKATTNSQGNFEMAGLKSGNYTVKSPPPDFVLRRLPAWCSAEAIS